MHVDGSQIHQTRSLMHAQLIEAEKQLAIAKDAYAKAIENIDRQYVKPLAGAGIADDEVRAFRGRYFLEVGTSDAAPATTAKKTRTPKGKQ
jgi:hypothetical protein